MSRADSAPARARSRRWSVAVGGTVLSLSLVLSGCSVAEEPAGVGGTEAGNTYLDGVLASPSQASADPLAGDIQFAGLLLRNHRDALEQSETVLGKDGLDREVRSIAERVQSEHEERIGQLESLLERWGVSADDVRVTGAEPSPTEPVDPSPGAEARPIVGDELRAGLVSDREKSILAAAGPEDAGRIYLLQMHRLHQGALTLSATEAEKGADDQAKQLAAAVVQSHREDMQRMVEILAEMGALGADGAETAPPSGYTGPIKIDGVGANGGDVPDGFVPEPVQRVQSFRATQKPVLPSSSASAASPSASPSPSPADTARPSPSPSSASSPSPSSNSSASASPSASATSR